MNQHETHESRSQSWLDFITLGLMALAAPCIAVLIHSAYVIHTGYRMYNAEITGLGGSTPFFSILALLGGGGVPAVPTFLALLPFRRRVLYRWIAWVGFIIVWTFILFKLEIAKH